MSISKSMQLNYYVKNDNELNNLKLEIEQFVIDSFKNKCENISVSMYDESKYLCFAKLSEDLIKIEVKVHK